MTTLIMGLELLTVVNATLCAILGPGLALRGPDGSMHTAVRARPRRRPPALPRRVRVRPQVNGMMTHYKFTLACFTAGLICFMFSALLYGWMQFDWSLALPMTFLLAYFLMTMRAPTPPRARARRPPPLAQPARRSAQLQVLHPHLPPLPPAARGRRHRLVQRRESYPISVCHCSHRHCRQLLVRYYSLSH